MALTVGTGPFGQHPGGTFNFERPRTKGVIWFEDSPRRIRARFGGETIVDSRHAHRGAAVHAFDRTGCAEPNPVRVFRPTGRCVRHRSRGGVGA